MRNRIAQRLLETHRPYGPTDQKIHEWDRELGPTTMVRYANMMSDRNYYLRTLPETLLDGIQRFTLYIRLEWDCWNFYTRNGYRAARAVCGSCYVGIKKSFVIENGHVPHGRESSSWTCPFCGRPLDRPEEFQTIGSHEILNEERCSRSREWQFISEAERQVIRILLSDNRDPTMFSEAKAIVRFLLLKVLNVQEFNPSAERISFLRREVLLLCRRYALPADRILQLLGDASREERFPYMDEFRGALIKEISANANS